MQLYWRELVISQYFYVVQIGLIKSLPKSNNFATFIHLNALFVVTCMSVPKITFLKRVFNGSGEEVESTEYSLYIKVQRKTTNLIENI